MLPSMKSICNQMGESIKYGTHGGFAKGMPKKLSTEPVVVPLTVALSSLTVGLLWRGATAP